MTALKQDGGWLYRDVFIAKQKSGFSFTITHAVYNAKGANSYRPLPSTLKDMMAQIDEMLSKGATAENRRIVKAGA
jgi:hypothetical protein